MTFLQRSASDLQRLATLLIRFAAHLTGFKPNNSDKTAQNAPTKAGLINAKMPGMNFAIKLVGAKVTRLKRKEVRDSLRRLLRSLINFNVPILKNGIQRVVYTNSNDFAAWRS
jgi:hypothetical protein